MQETHESSKGEVRHTWLAPTTPLLAQFRCGSLSDARSLACQCDCSCGGAAHASTPGNHGVSASEDCTCTHVVLLFEVNPRPKGALYASETGPGRHRLDDSIYLVANSTQDDRVSNCCEWMVLNGVCRPSSYGWDSGVDVWCVYHTCVPKCSVRLPYGC
jgi:hypothetical protein